MSITASQAIAQLSGINTLGELEGLISQIDTYSSGNTTVLYSGVTNGYLSSAYAEILAGDPSLRLIDKTELGKFLSFDADGNGNQELRAWLDSRFNSDPTEIGSAANKYWYGTVENPGLWDYASEKFVSETVGEVRALVGNAGDDSVFARTELPALLRNSAITSVNGLEMRFWKVMDGEGAVLDALRHSTRMLSFITDVSPTNFNGFKAADLAASVGDYFSGHTTKFGEYVRGFQDTLKNSPAEWEMLHDGYMRIRSGAENLAQSGLAKNLNKLGPIAGFVGLTLTLSSAANAAEDENMEEAGNILVDWAVSNAGSEIGSLVGVTVAGVGLALVGAPGLLAGATVMAVAMAGGYFGGEGAEKYYAMFKNAHPDAQKMIAEGVANFLFGGTDSFSSNFVSPIGDDNQFNFESATGENIAELAKTHVEWRYALLHLNPWAIADVDYVNSSDPFHQNHLNPNDELNVNNFSDQFLIDRAQMTTMRWDALRNGFDISPDEDLTVVVGHGEISFSDFITGQEVHYSKDGNVTAQTGMDVQHIVFGDDGNNVFLEGFQFGNKDDHLYGGAGADTLAGGGGNDYLEGNAGTDTLKASLGFDHLSGGADADTYDFSADFDNVIISGDTDNSINTISILSGVTFHRIGPGEANTDGLYVCTDGDQKGWSVSVSGSTATVSVKTTGDKTHTIIINDFAFSDASNNFGINLQKAELPEAPDAAANVFAVPENHGFVDNYTPPDDGNPDTTEEPIAIYFPNVRNVSNNPDMVAQNANFDFERFRGTDNGIDYDAQTVHGNWDSADNYNDDGNLKPAPHSMSDAVFEGSNTNDTLDGKDWTSDIQNAKTWSDSNGGFYGNSTNAEKTWMNDVLFGLDGDDVLTGDGSSTDEVVGNTDTLIGGRGSDQLYGGGGDDWLFAWEEYRGGNVASYGLDKGDKATRDEALYKGTIANIEIENESNYLNGGDGDDFVIGGSFDDTLLGGKGNDRIWAGAGRDVISAGDDTPDTINFMYGDSYALFRSGYWSPDFIAPDKAPQADDYSRAYFYKDNNGTTELRYNDDLYNQAKTNADKQKEYKALFNDVIAGSGAVDFILGEIGDDIISGGGGDDQLFGDRSFATGFYDSAFTANDGTVQGLDKQFHGNDVIDGGAGDDLIVGGAGDDRLTGGDENAVGNDSNDTIYGDVGFNTADRVSSVRSGESLADVTDSAWWGKDFIEGGKGNDYLVGEGNADVIDGGDDNDTLYGDWRADKQLIAIQTANAQAGKDTLYGGKGNDTLYGGGNDDTLEGGAGTDTLYGDDNTANATQQGNDTLIGGSGDDFLYGEKGNDKYIINLGDGNDTITDVDGQNVLQLSGAALVNGRVAAQQSAAGDVKIYLNADKTQYISMSAETLHSFTGRVQDASGNRLQVAVDVAAGAGADYVATVSAEGGDSLTVHNTATANNLVQFSGDMQLAQTRTSITREGNGISMDLELVGDVDALNVNIDNWNNFYGLFDASGKALGFVLDESANTEADRIIAGKTGSDEILGGVAAENLLGNGGDDTLLGGAGDDYLSGGEGDDVYVVHNGDGADIINDTLGSNTLQLSDVAAGSALVVEQISSDDAEAFLRLYVSADRTQYVDLDQASWAAMQDIRNGDGSAAALDIVGSDGYMAMLGGAGDDTYRMAANGFYNIYSRTENGTELLQLPDGMTLADFRAQRSGNDLLLRSQDGSTSAAVRGFFAAQPAEREWWIGDDVTAQDLQTWVDEQPVDQPSSDNPLLDAARSAFEQQLLLDLMDMGRSGTSLFGSDLQFYGVNGAGSYYSASLSQWMPLDSYHFSGVREQDVNAGLVTMTGSSQVDNVDISHHYSTHVWYTYTYKDVWVPGYSYAPYGAINNLGQFYAFWVEVPGYMSKVESGKIRHAEVVDAPSAAVHRTFAVQHVTGGDEDNVVVGDRTFAGSIMLGGGDNTVATQGISRMHEINSSYIRRQGVFVETGDGNDVIYGSAYDDVFFLGAGVNYVEGGAGDDAYYVNMSATTVTRIRDVGVSLTYGLHFEDDVNRIVFDADTTLDSLSYCWRGDEYVADEYNDVLQLSSGSADLFVNHGGTTIRFEGSITDDNFGVQLYQFYDGTILSQAQLLAELDARGNVLDADRQPSVPEVAFAEDRVIENGNFQYEWRKDYDNIVIGSAGNETLRGYAGADTFFGGVGNDVLDGGEGADVYVFESGDGLDECMVQDGDVIRFGSGIRWASILTFRDGDDLHIYYGDNDHLWVHDAFAAGSLWVLQFDDHPADTRLFADVADAIPLMPNVIEGTSHPDALEGGGGNDWVLGKGGDDYMFGREGDDILNGGVGDDTLDGGEGNDTYWFFGRFDYDEIEDYAGDNNLRFADAKSSEVQLSRWVDDLIACVPDTDSFTYIYGAFYPFEGAATWQLQFADGVTWMLDDIRDAVAWDSVATEGDDHIERGSDGDVVDGLAGNDAIDGRAGNDSLLGGEGNDWIYGGDGDDVLLGGEGDDVLVGDAGDDTLLGSSGADGFWFEFYEGGDSGCDVISDADTSDYIYIGAQLQNAIDISRIDDDTLLIDYNHGEASVEIHGSAGTLELNGILQLDAFKDRTLTLTSGSGITEGVSIIASDLLGNSMDAVEKARWQLVAIADTSDYAHGEAGFLSLPGWDTDSNGVYDTIIFLENFYGSGLNVGLFAPSASGTGSFSYKLQRDDGLTYSGSMHVNITDGLLLNGTAGDDIMDAAPSTIGVAMDGLAGDDLLRDSPNDDVVHGGDGNDILTHNWAGNGSDTLYGDAGDDYLDSGWSSANTDPDGNPYGRWDAMVGGTGNDTYFEGNMWSGDNSLIDNRDAAVGDVDTLIVDGVSDYRALWFAQDGDDLVVTQLDAVVQGQVRVDGWFDAMAPEAKLDAIRVQAWNGDVAVIDSNQSGFDTAFANLLNAMATFSADHGGALPNSATQDVQDMWGSELIGISSYVRAVPG